MTDTTTASDINLDSRALAELMSVIAMNQMIGFGGADDYFISGFSAMKTKEIDGLFKRSNLIRRVVMELPRSATIAGYNVKDGKDKIIAKANIQIMKAFNDGAVFARKYGVAYAILKTNLTDFKKPLQPGEQVLDHSIKLDLKRSGDFYVDKDNARIAHASKVYSFVGDRTFEVDLDFDDDGYAHSVLQGLVISLKDFYVSTQYGRKIMKNLSNLTLGVKGLGMKLRTDAGKKEIGSRLASFDNNRSIESAIMFDMENEAVNYISQSLQNVPELLQELQSIFTANTEYPITKLFTSQSANGLSSGAQNQLIVRFEWASQVAEWSKLHYIPNLNRLYDTLTGDSLDTHVDIDLPLALTDEEIISIEEKAANRFKVLIECGIITAQEARRSYLGNGVNLNIILDDELPTDSTLNDQSTSIESGNENEDSKEFTDEYWIALSRITLDDIDIVAEQAIE